MASIKQYVVLLLAVVSFIYTLYVVTHLVQFLSAPRKTSKIYTWVFNLLDNKSRLETAYGPMVFNTLYLILFIFQHSFMKSSWAKKVFQSIGLASAERAIYSLTSSFCLHVCTLSQHTTTVLYLMNVLNFCLLVFNEKLDNSIIYNFVASRCRCIQMVMVVICFVARICVDDYLWWQYDNGFARNYWN